VKCSGKEGWLKAMSVEHPENRHVVGKHKVAGLVKEGGLAHQLLAVRVVKDHVAAV